MVSSVQNVGNTPSSFPDQNKENVTAAAQNMQSELGGFIDNLNALQGEGTSSLQNGDFLQKVAGQIQGLNEMAEKVLGK